MRICRRKRVSSFSRRILCRRPVASPSLVSGTCSKIISSMTLGQNFTAPTMATSMKAMPIIGAKTVLKMSKSPVKLNRTLNKTSERMSSTKAAVMMACPKSICSTPASPRSRSAMPTLVGARAVPAEMPSGCRGRPKAIISREPTMSGRMVPRTATKQALTPTTRAFSKSKCMPLSKIIKATPAWPMSVNTSGVRPQWWLTSASHRFWRHSAKVVYSAPPPPPPESRRPPSLPCATTWWLAPGLTADAAVLPWPGLPTLSEWPTPSLWLSVVAGTWWLSENKWMSQLSALLNLDRCFPRSCPPCANCNTFAGGSHSACRACSHVAYSSTMSPATWGPNTTPVDISRTIEETPNSLENLDAIQAALKNPQIESMA
mmetsp:Transcript_61189/g.189552  ORF Transcript_61189/g.189552 Transcript_61189/m.189552 type:complete len:374 (+) Transcript_61189:1217-2338(+)